MSRRRRWVLGSVVLLLVGLPLAAELAPDELVPGPVTTIRVLTEGDDPRPVDFADGTGPGSVLSAETMPGLPWRTRLYAHAARVTYRSTGPGGAESVVSGVVVVPRGTPPEGGWPVLSYAHGSTGIHEECAPSLSEDLSGSLDLVTAYARAGYAVALTDYEGLGAPGVHPYLDAPVAGLNVIDAVRALRAVYPDAGSRWLALGGSQGGGAAWAANEQAAAYAPELTLVGSVSIAPAADLTGLATDAVDGSLTPDQAAGLQWFLAAQSEVHPTLRLDELRRGATADDWDVLTQCAPGTGEARAAALESMDVRDLAPQTGEARRQLATLLGSVALPRYPATAPMLVIYGSDDTYVDAAWTTSAIARGRALGDEIDADLQQGRGHGDLDTARVLSWITTRFAAGG